MYVRVYSPEGEPFDVPQDRASNLILLNGWTQSMPKVAPVEETPVEETEVTVAPEADVTEEITPRRKRSRRARKDDA